MRSLVLLLSFLILSAFFGFCAGILSPNPTDVRAFGFLSGISFLMYAKILRSLQLPRVRLPFRVSVRNRLLFVDPGCFAFGFRFRTWIVWTPTGGLSKRKHYGISLYYGPDVYRHVFRWIGPGWIFLGRIRLYRQRRGFRLYVTAR